MPHAAPLSLESKAPSPQAKTGTFPSTPAWLFDPIYSVPADLLLLLTNFQPIPIRDFLDICIVFECPAITFAGHSAKLLRKGSESSVCLL